MNKNPSFPRRRESRALKKKALGPRLRGDDGVLGPAFAGTTQ